MSVVSFSTNYPFITKALDGIQVVYGIWRKAQHRLGKSCSYIIPEVPVAFNSVLCISRIKAALLMMVAHEDEMPRANSDVARYAYSLTPEPRQLVEVEGGHFGIVEFPRPLFDKASRTQADFFVEYLK